MRANADTTSSCSQIGVLSAASLEIAWRNANGTMLHGKPNTRVRCTFVKTDNYGFTWIKTKINHQFL